MIGLAGKSESGALQSYPAVSHGRGGETCFKDYKSTAIDLRRVAYNKKMGAVNEVPRIKSLQGIERVANSASRLASRFRRGERGSGAAPWEDWAIAGGCGTQEQREATACDMHTYLLCV